MDSYKYWRHIFRDFFILAGSIIVAIVLAKGGFIHNLLNLTDSHIIASLVSGAFFTSVFTLAPATVGLIGISRESSPLFVAFFGAFGAMTIDLLIYRFIKKDISRDLNQVTKNLNLKTHFLRAFHIGFLKWLAFFLGLFFIASPFPDEFGLFLLGISKIKSWTLPFVFYIANFAGILIIISIATSIS